MQLILDTVPVLREEDRQELLRVMPSYVSHNWEVRRSLQELLPGVEDEGEKGTGLKFTTDDVPVKCFSAD